MVEDETKMTCSRQLKLGVSDKETQKEKMENTITEFIPNIINPQKELVSLLEKISKYWEAKEKNYFIFDKEYKIEKKEVIKILEIYRRKFLYGLKEDKKNLEVLK